MICCSSDSNKDDVVLCTQHLINAGVDVNALDRFGSSALFFAVKKNNIKCIEELLKNNAQVNGTDTKSFTVCLLIN